MDPNNYSKYEFYVEVLNTLLVLLSTQLHRVKLTESNYFLEILLQRFSDRANAVVAKLLENFIEQKVPPPQSSNVVYNAYSYFFSSRQNSASDADTFPVADRSLLLMLLLATQSKILNDDETSGVASAYRLAFANLRDHHVLASDLEASDKKYHLISFKDLFGLFCQSLGIEERMLLFYVMLVENDSFRVYVLSRTDPETIYIPILKIIYEAVEGKTNYSQVYILLIILLVLSQDDVNNETIQKITVTNLTWFTERPLLKSISLGGMVILVLIRTLQFNLSHQKDIYFHTNCLAILANMSCTILDMHAYVAQRIISLFELISRRQQKLATKIAHDNSNEHSPQDIAVYEDMLSLVLEIINSILHHRLKNNTQLVYALLLKREIFAPLRNHARLADLIKNIETVIDYFHVRVSEANIKAPSTGEILDLIDQAARTWTPNRLGPIPDLKFQYEEEQDSREFFVPYVWALIHRRGFIYWTEEKAHILNEYRIMSGADDDLEAVHDTSGKA
ncbi:Dymeclin [Zychaea mexicana]|uniref:Dymeclin n=1 Tax=Zychaea mexicana TaxID=64656 RepID=UPI0022FE3F49|nr:Dymeclin [Zychaea mexicana]KAI9489961.1 Dymeclin [Zychaea mexicana]